jgi:DNA replicative helicase MCM subunit Mcm2 (Cdc46/Mcm family)
MRLLLDIIQRLCTESEDNSVNRADIISEAEIQGIESRKVEEALDRLSRDGQVYKTPKGKYGIA